MNRIPPAMRRSRAGGTLYIVVLSVSLIVTVIGVGALLGNRVYHQRVEDSSAMAAARVLAQSAVDMAMYRIKNDANWRTTYTNNTWITNQTLGTGSYSFKLVDEEDANLASGGTQRVRIHGRGVAGNALRIYSVEMIPVTGTTAMLRSPTTWRRETLP